MVDPFPGLIPKLNSDRPGNEATSSLWLVVGS